MASFILFGKERKEVSCGGTIWSAVADLGMHPDAFIFLVNGIPVPMDTEISDNTEIKAIRVASGG